MTSRRALIIGALVVAALVAIVLFRVLGSQPDPRIAENACRAQARAVFPALLSRPPTMTQVQGQAMIDQACSGVGAEQRRAIIDSERLAAMSRSLP